MKTLPPFLASVFLVTILIVPPTEEIPRREAPRPRCTCTIEDTSESPAQLLQYTLPPSISFTGTPLISTPRLSVSKPRIMIRESPKPPPERVTYTEGVDLRSSGNSVLKALDSICLREILLTGTGTLRSLGTTEAITST